MFFFMNLNCNTIYVGAHVLNTWILNADYALIILRYYIT
jgi:hypothetical protein